MSYGWYVHRFIHLGLEVARKVLLLRYVLYSRQLFLYETTKVSVMPTTALAFRARLVLHSQRPQEDPREAPVELRLLGGALGSREHGHKGWAEGWAKQ